MQKITRFITAWQKMSYNSTRIWFLLALTDWCVFAEGQGGAPGPEHMPAWRRHTFGVSEHRDPREAMGRMDSQPCVVGWWDGGRQRLWPEAGEAQTASKRTPCSWSRAKEQNRYPERGPARAVPQRGWMKPSLTPLLPWLPAGAGPGDLLTSLPTWVTLWRSFIV